MQLVAITTLGHQADIGNNKIACRGNFIAVVIISIVAGIIALAVIVITARLIILLIPSWFFSTVFVGFTL
ncbi:hypothetical protein D3C84_1275350 [compost metagenome]